MGKVLIGAERLVFPTPVVLVGANVNGKANFMAVAWCGIVNSEPPTLSVSIRPQRYTLAGIKQNSTFSVNVPSVDMVKEADYCGIVTGAKIDKVKVCCFSVFYGKLSTAPLIQECPVNIECRVLHILTLESHLLFIGRIEEVHVSEECLVGGRLDMTKARPFVYTASPSSPQYQALGEYIGTQYSIGKELHEREAKS